MLFRRLKAIIYGWVAISGLASAKSPSPLAKIDAGVIIGTATSLPSATATVNKFLGIPFAASPPERFSPPRKPRRWSKPLIAQAWKPACIQQFIYPEASQNFIISVFNNPPPEESEDCLYLNVYAPAAPASGKGRAVMFWIYGGSLQFGNAGQTNYDGSHLAAYEDVIVVTANYRTNVFGFPSSPELPLTGHNLGFLDQRLGLAWVQRNIHAFGGDPEKVTIFGESAGALSVDALLTSFPKGSKPPFRGGILQSGQISYGSQCTDSTPAWYALATALDCSKYKSNLTCIRAAPAATIKSIIEHEVLVFNPVPDNITLVSNPALARTSGSIANIPVLSGTNAQEGRVFAVGQNDIMAYLETIFGDYPQLIQEIAAAYPLGQNGLNTPYDVIAQIETELLFQCPCALFAKASAAAGIPSWRYYFNAPFLNTQGFPGAGVYHASEIPIVFTTYESTNATAQEYALSSFMRGVWARFAKNPAGGPGWNAVGTGDSFLGGSADLDLGYLGFDGSSGVTVVNEIYVDYRCPLYVPLYNQ